MKKIIGFLLAALFAVSVSLAHAQEAAGQQLSEAELAEGIETIKSFLTLWWVDKDIEGAAKYFSIRGTEEQRQLMHNFSLKKPEEIDLWLKKMLVLLLSNRDDVITRAKAQGNAGHALYRHLPAQANKEADLIQAEKWQDVLTTSGAFLFGNTWIASFGLLHARDRGGYFHINFEKIGGVWRITNFILSTGQ